MPSFPAEIRPLFDRFTRGPAAVRKAILGLDAGALNGRRPGDDWSVRDIIIHLADTELVRAVRIRKVIAEDRPLLETYDERLWKRRLHYLWRDPEAALAEFELTRFQTASILAQCDAAAWKREAVHAGRGVITLRDMLALGVDHVDEHVAQVAVIRAYLNR
ncbi:MAG: DinB family protein [Chloroflexi bacterium]|nr:DinB family protein [Chloroflexota bacterium]